MDFIDYQDVVISTAVYPEKNKITYPMLGLGGEVGEMMNKYKKVLRGDTTLTIKLRSDLIKELGDVLWYVAKLADDLGSELRTVAFLNATKLLERKEKGTLRGEGDER